MFVLGLTGSIAMGKSTCAQMFRRLGIPVHDADTAVHAAMAHGGPAFEQISAQFPAAIVDGVIDRQKLGATVFADPVQLRRLEDILHPLAAASAVGFLRRHAYARAPLVVLDIPLLFEAGARDRVDAVLVVSAPTFLQRQRALARAGMTEQKLAQILSRQMPDADKRARADFIVTSGLGRAETFAGISRLTAVLKTVPGSVWRPAYAI